MIDQPCPVCRDFCDRPLDDSPLDVSKEPESYKLLLQKLAERTINWEIQAARLKSSALTHERQQGKFYSWSASQLRFILARNGRALKAYFGTRDLAKIYKIDEEKSK